MNTQEFNELVNRRCELIKAVLTRKAGEYATDADRFHNFTMAGMMHPQESPERALVGMWKKHLVSVMDMIDKPVDQALIDEKIGDLINYAILLEGMLTERTIYRRVD